MSVRTRLSLAFCLAALGFAVSLGVIWAIAFKRGEERGREKNQVAVANDGAFYCLSGLKALEGSDKYKLVLQISLDGEALKLSRICLTNPEWIGRSNYTLLKRVHAYLVDHSDERSTNKSLRPSEQVTSKIAEAIAHLESVHNIDEWHDPGTRIEFKDP